MRGPPPCLDQSSERVSKSGVLKTSLDCAEEAPLTLSALASQNSPLQRVV